MQKLKQYIELIEEVRRRDNLLKKMLIKQLVRDHFLRFRPVINTAFY